MKTLPLLLSLAVISASQATDSSSAINAPAVRVPLGDLWLTTGQASDPEPEKPAPPPVAAALLSAVYTLDLSEQPPVLRLTATAENFTNSWQLVPIHGDGFVFTADDPSGLVRKDNQLQWLSESRGVRTFELTAAVPESRGEVWQMPVHPVPAAHSLLVISGPPEGRQILVHGATALETNGPDTHWHLPGDGQPVRIELAKPRRILPSEWQLAATLVVKPEEQWLAYDARLQLSARTGSALESRVQLPTNARELAVSGEDLESWNVQREENGTGILHLKWRTRDVPDRRISLRYKISQAPLADVWELSAPSLANGNNHNHFIVVSPAGAKISGPGLQENVARNRLPSWMAEAVGAASFAVVTADSGTRLNVSWLPQVETAAAVVTKGAHRSRIVEDGSMLTEANYQIALEQPTSWRITLPKGSRLLACTVDGKSAEPVVVEDALEFSLPAAATREAKVYFSYTSNAGALDLIGGRLELTLPVTPLFAHELSWHLSLPSSYEIEAVESNLTLDPRVDASNSGDLLLTKRLTRDVTPATEIFYKKRGIAQPSN